MTPEEFEEYLGLQGPSGGFDHQEFYYGTEPQPDREHMIDKFISESQNMVEQDSNVNQPVVSAGADLHHMYTEGDQERQEANGPSSMFDSFDQEEQKLVEAITKSEKSRQSTVKSSQQVKSSVAVAGSKFNSKVKAKDFMTGSTTKQDYIKANRE